MLKIITMYIEITSSYGMKAQVHHYLWFMTICVIEIRENQRWILEYIIWMIIL